MNSAITPTFKNGIVFGGGGKITYNLSIALDQTGRSYSIAFGI
jgi:hypothetical protein